MLFPAQLIDVLLNSIEVGIVIYNHNFEAIYINPFISKLFNVSDTTNFNALKFIPKPSSNLEDHILTYGEKTLKVTWGKKVLENMKFYLAYIEDITLQADKDYKLTCLEQIVDNIHEGIIASDRKGNIFVFNKASEKLEGLSKISMLGSNLFDVYDLNMQNCQHYLVAKTKQPRLGIFENFFTKEGKKITTISDNYPVMKDGETIGSYSIARNITKIKELLDQAIELQQKLSASEIYKRHCRYQFSNIIGNSQLIQHAITKAKKAAESDCSVLIVGETGTGKELFVQSIHEKSFKCHEPFIPINCAAIPESLLESLLFGTVKGAFTGATENTGLFEQAGKGTLFLDELNSMSLNVQSKILRALQERTIRKIGGKKEIPIHCRIISTTNQEPLESIKEGTLRQDLFYRLAVVTIYIPPLRERREDIAPLTDHFLKVFNQKYHTSVAGVSSDLMELFMRYHWPGNIRELQNLIESAINTIENEDKISLEHTPYYFYNLFAGKKASYPHVLNSQDSILPKVLTKVEENFIFDALSKFKGNVSQAANFLGIPRQNLNYKIKKLGIDLNKIRNQ